MSDETFKQEFTDLVIKINQEKDKAKREDLCDKLKLMAWDFGLEGCDDTSYKGGVLMDNYVNFDSNSGLTIVYAYAGISAIADYLKSEADTNEPFTLSEAADVMTSEMDERDEHWEDLIDDDFYVYNGETNKEVISGLISELTKIRENKTTNEEAFIKDLNEALEELKEKER